MLPFSCYMRFLKTAKPIIRLLETSFYQSRCLRGGATIDQACRHRSLFIVRRGTTLGMGAKGCKGGHTGGNQGYKKEKIVYKQRLKVIQDPYEILHTASYIHPTNNSAIISVVVVFVFIQKCFELHVHCTIGFFTINFDQTLKRRRKKIKNIQLKCIKVELSLLLVLNQF